MSEMTIGIGLAVITFLGFGGLISHFLDLPFFASAIGICLVFWLHNSFVTWDDEMPGGYDNPAPNSDIPQDRQGVNKLKFWLVKLSVASVMALLVFYCGINQY
jgi:hypothetical protein